MRTRYYCDIQIFLKSGTTEMGFSRTCKTRKAAEELAHWLHRQYAEAADSEVLTLELPCRRNQPPCMLSFRTQDVCAITTVIDRYKDEESYKIEPGFRVTGENRPVQDVRGGEPDRELVARQIS